MATTTDSYAQALVALVHKGMSPKDAVNKLAEMLKKTGKSRIMAQLKPALMRLQNKESGAVVYVAHKHDAKHAPQASDTRVIIDDSLIGGWRMVNGNTLVDASYKKQLLDMYRGATRS